ncbi:GNAT family N-acetyltransferase [Streptomyces cavernicola]|uniref:GNAT family N-acetyltransferase n=1 Tax=Streptomyces cavernicola TaxID=3043613 RepID=A0ABT6SHH9_9ACTN|nr:GNAT family N-acetyltransferase [Streptomyces sp. B-S-A6]MDI3407656.1 GNAT family N-acetyltransferase [Streptomyces sp. B-S-A6]
MYPISRTSARLKLRELTVDDVDAVHAIYGSAEATEHLSFEPRTRDQVGQIAVRSIAAASKTPRDEYALAVIERDSTALIGFARLALDPHQQQGATIGFALRPDAWGVGYGVETVQLLLEVGFGELGLHRIWGARSPHNSASAKTMLTAGMSEDYTIREHIQKAGEWRDSVVHTILRHEWQTVQQVV